MSVAHPPRAKRAAPGRERILDEARSLFIAHGFDSVSMQQIADAAQVNKATLFHHFGDKEGLFVAVMREEIAGVRAALTDELAAGGPIREQLKRITTRFLGLRHSDIGQMGHDLKEHVSERLRHELMGEQMLPWELLGPVFARAMDSGEVRKMDPNLAVSLFVGAIAFQVQCARFASATEEAPDLGPDFADTIADIVLDGIGVGQRRGED